MWFLSLLVYLLFSCHSSSNCLKEFGVILLFVFHFLLKAIGKLWKQTREGVHDCFFASFLFFITERIKRFCRKGGKRKIFGFAIPL